MIPILEGGGVSALNAGGSAAVPQGGAGTGSGDSFPEILNAQGPPGPGGDPDQLPSDAATNGGNPVLPGGKKLPPSPGEHDPGTDAATTGLPAIALTPQVPLSPAAGSSVVPPAQPQAAAPQLQSSDTPSQPASTGNVTVPVATAAPTIELTSTVQPDPSGETDIATPVTPGKGTPVPAGQQALLTAAPETAAAVQPGGTPPTGNAATAAPVGTDSVELVQPGPAATANVRGAGVPLDGTARRAPEVAAPVSRDGGPAPDTLVRPAAELRVPSVPEIAAANSRLQAAADDAPVVRLPAEALATTPGAEPGRPATTTAAPVTTALGAPLTFPATDAAVPLGSRVDVTGVLVARPGEQAWNREVAGRLSLMLRSGTSEANLQLNPPELGRMEVRIATEGDHARIHFTVHGADTRDVIEQALPRLRDMLEQGGLSLSSFDVADQSQSNRDYNDDVPTGFNNSEIAVEEIRGGLAEQAVSARANALVDYYV